MIQKTNKAFTLIELLIVIAIIGLLASIVMGALGTARAKGRDALRKQDMQQLKTALNLYYQNTGTMPANQTIGIGYSDTQPNFLIELVNTGILAKIPHAPAGGAPYYYYDYGLGNNGVGALVTTVLEASTASVTGEQGTCRPWPVSSGVGWCEQSVSQWYCLCNTY
ncbi:MAG: hypothetical protein JWO40_101 [Candidatus Doudnabacteria bacterium]|nr:hypothetical protein [Candidatus Doudnabacteria bacterium]